MKILVLINGLQALNHLDLVLEVMVADLVLEVMEDIMEEGVALADLLEEADFLDEVEDLDEDEDSDEPLVLD